VTLEDVRAFVAVFESGNLSAVARSLGCTQPAVRHHIARLEKDLAVSLFERRAKGVRATAAGQLLYEGLRTGLNCIEGGVRDVLRWREGESGELTVTTGGTTVRHLLRDTVVEFRRRFPSAVLGFVPAHSSQHCLELLQRDAADLAFVTIHPGETGLRQWTAIEVPMVLVVPAEDPLSLRRHVQIEELQSIRYVALPKGTSTYAVIDSVLQKHGVTLRASATVDDFDTAVLFVQLGLGHTIVPAVHARNLLSGSDARALEIVDFPRIALGWAALRFASLTPLSREFIRLFSATARKWPKLKGMVLPSPEGP
jgi:DNA-binding transcriptional LysR family regulator